MSLDWKDLNNDISLDLTSEQYRGPTTNYGDVPPSPFDGSIQQSVLYKTAEALKKIGVPNLQQSLFPWKVVTLGWLLEKNKVRIGPLNGVEENNPDRDKVWGIYNAAYLNGNNSYFFCFRWMFNFNNNDNYVPVGDIGAIIKRQITGRCQADNIYANQDSITQSIDLSKIIIPLIKNSIDYSVPVTGLGCLGYTGNKNNEKGGNFQGRWFHALPKSGYTSVGCIGDSSNRNLCDTIFKRKIEGYSLVKNIYLTKIKNKNPNYVQLDQCDRNMDCCFFVRPTSYFCTYSLGKSGYVGDNDNMKFYDFIPDAYYDLVSAGLLTIDNLNDVNNNKLTIPANWMLDRCNIPDGNFKGLTCIKWLENKADLSDSDINDILNNYCNTLRNKNLTKSEMYKKNCACFPSEKEKIDSLQLVLTGLPENAKNNLLSLPIRCSYEPCSKSGVFKDKPIDMKCPDSSFLTCLSQSSIEVGSMSESPIKLTQVNNCMLEKGDSGYDDGPSYVPPPKKESNSLLYGGVGMGISLSVCCCCVIIIIAIVMMMSGENNPP